MAAKPKVGFGIVGLGGRAQTLISIIIDHPETKLTHVCDLKAVVLEKQRKALSKEISGKISFSKDFSELLADDAVDAVIITTPDGTHERLAVQAFQARKHVFLEKPVGINLDEMLNVLNASISSGKKLVVGYQARHIPFFSTIKKLLDPGENGPIGRPLFVQANEFYYGGYHYFRSWWRHKKNTGGVMVQKICHDFDMMHYYFGKPVRVSCFGSNIEFTKGNAPKGSEALLCRDCPPEQRCEYYIKNDESSSYKTDQCVYNADHDIMDNTQTLIQFQNGLVVCLGMHFFPSKAQNSRFWKISGSKADLYGKVKDDLLLVNPRWDRSENQREAIMYKVPEREDRPAKFLIDDMLRGIREGVDVEPGLKSAYWSMLLVVGAQMALETNRVIDLLELAKKYPFPIDRTELD